MDLPKLLLGTSPFIGAGQFGSKALEYQRQFYDTPENMTKLFIHSSKLGVNAVQLVGHEPLVEALRKAEETAGDFFVAATLPEGDFASNLDLVSSLEPEFVAVHAFFCDRFDPRIEEWIDKIKDTGAKPAASTHNPGTSIPLLESYGFEAYLAPLNPLGYMMKPDFESTLRAVRNTKNQVIAIKPLAAGKLFPDRNLFEFIFRYADSIAVGIASENEMTETYSIALETPVQA
jgi:hypothetical protein